MRKAKKGRLYYDENIDWSEDAGPSGRWEIYFDDTSYFGGIYNGDTLEVLIDSVWVPTCAKYHIDLASNEEKSIKDCWSLEGLFEPGEIPDELTVRR